MKLLIDACVLYPTVMRKVVLGVAKRGAFTPLWSLRILEEWARAAARHGAVQGMQARGEIALLRSAWPNAIVEAQPGLEARLWLPDPADIHVLAAAIAGSADTIMTLNAKDFPRGTLAEEGVSRIDPDGYLHQLWVDQPDLVADAAQEVLQNARALSDNDWDMRPLL